MKKSIIYLVLIVFSTAAFAQKGATRKLDKFTSISVSEGIDVNLIKGNTPQAKIKVDNIDLEDVLTEVSGSTLKIHLDGNNHNNVDVNIDLTYVSLESVKASSAADIKSSSVIEATDFKIEASSAADVILELKVSTLDVEASSAADVTVSGTANSQTVDISSASDYKAFELKCKSADISASSAADARVTAESSLEASASSGASIKYKGNPDKLRERSSSGGSVREY
jgi:putative autotransporter adhesin-like protein